MQTILFDSTILGALTSGQGSINAVAGTHRATLRELASHAARGLFRHLGQWHALLLKRQPAGWMPVAATCSMSSDRRYQRDPRWVSGVVVEPGTVGVR